MNLLEDSNDDNKFFHSTLHQKYHAIPPSQDRDSLLIHESSKFFYWYDYRFDFKILGVQGYLQPKIGSWPTTLER